MSEQNETATNAQADATPGEVVYSLKTTKEIADRFRGDHEIRYRIPVAVPGNLEATLANLREFVDPQADFATVLVDKFNGQGYRLDVQKVVKDLLRPESQGGLKSDVSTEDGLQQAQDLATSHRAGTTRPRAAGGGAKGKVAQAEARAAKIATSALDMYRAVRKQDRPRIREMLISSNAFTAEQLDAVDAEGQDG